MRILGICTRLQLAQLRSAMAYRGDFWIALVGAVLQQFVGLTFLITFFGQVPKLGSWTMPEVLMLHGLVTAILGMGEMFTDGVWRLRIDVNEGSFDRVLVRPLPPVLQQMTQIASIHGTGNLAVGLAAFGYGIAHSSVAWHWWTLPVILLAFACGCVLNACINLLSNCIAFWEPSATSSFPTMVGVMRDFAKFPLDIYGVVVKTIATFAVPFAAITYWPVCLVLQRPGAHGWWALTPVLAAGATLALASLVWRRGLAAYQGVGH